MPPSSCCWLAAAVAAEDSERESKSSAAAMEVESLDATAAFLLLTIAAEDGEEGHQMEVVAPLPSCCYDEC